MLIGGEIAPQVPDTCSTTGGSSTTTGRSTAGGNTSGNNGGGGLPGYKGIWTGSFSNTSGARCKNFSASLTIESVGSDILCQVNQCFINMTESHFRSVDLKKYQFKKLTGTVDRFGRVSDTDTSCCPGQFTLYFPSSRSSAGQESQLYINGTSTITFYINSPNSCHGTFNVRKN